MAYIKLSKENFRHNIGQFCQYINMEKLCLGLKDNAYGHGIVSISKLFRNSGGKHCFVRNESEALQVIDHGYSSILVLYPESFGILDESVFYAINSIEQLKKASNDCNLELKIDSGMGRNGILPAELNDAIKIMQEKNLNIKGVFTHFYASDECDVTTVEQKTLFDNLIKSLVQQLPKPMRIHCMNSGSVTSISCDNYDIARIGIGLYGYGRMNLDLKPVLSLYAKKISTRVLKKGQRVGYGIPGYVVKNNELVVSNYDCGYGDGFPRISENEIFYSYIGVPSIGRSSMDSISFNSSVDELCIFNDASEIAKLKNTIIYDILVSLKESLTRKLV